jgi:hypothetical protein
MHRQANPAGGPAGGCAETPCLADIARLLVRSAALYWRGYQRALLHGKGERARDLEAMACRYEETADLCDAFAWEPKVRPRRLSTEERARLDRILKPKVIDASDKFWSRRIKVAAGTVGEPRAYASPRCAAKPRSRPRQSVCVTRR